MPNGNRLAVAGAAGEAVPVCGELRPFVADRDEARDHSTELLLCVEAGFLLFLTSEFRHATGVSLLSADGKRLTLQLWPRLPLLAANADPRPPGAATGFIDLLG